MVDWAFILKDADGFSEPEARCVRNFLKDLGRRHGLKVAFAPVPIGEPQEMTDQALSPDSQAMAEVPR